jgi:hypothetical protein
LLKCFYKPNRSHRREFSKEDCARIICRVLADLENQPRTAKTGFGASPAAGIGGPRQFFDQDLKDILARVERRCGRSSSKKDPALEQALAAEAADLDSAQITAFTISQLEFAQTQIESNNVLWSSVLEWTGALVTFLTLVATALKFVPIPAVRLVSQGANFILKRVAGFQGSIIARRAANDSTFAVIERNIQLFKKAA